MGAVTITTNDGQVIHVLRGAWVGAPGLYGPDELRDIADALEGDYEECEDGYDWDR